MKKQTKIILIVVICILMTFTVTYLYMDAEIRNYKKLGNETLFNREDYWNKEIIDTKNIYQNQIDNLLSNVSCILNLGFDNDTFEEKNKIAGTWESLFFADSFICFVDSLNYTFHENGSFTGDLIFNKYYWDILNTSCGYMLIISNETAVIFVLKYDFSEYNSLPNNLLQCTNYDGEEYTFNKII